MAGKGLDMLNTCSEYFEDYVAKSKLGGCFTPTHFISDLLGVNDLWLIWPRWTVAFVFVFLISPYQTDCPLSTHVAQNANIART